MKHQIVRFQNCSTNTQNYNLCLKTQIAGFTKLGANPGEVVFFLARDSSQNETLCGMRAVLHEKTENKPWPDAENYAVAYTLREISFAKSFVISKFFREVINEKYWGIKWVQGSKAIRKTEAFLPQLNKAFDEHLTTNPDYFALAPSEEDLVVEDLALDEAAIEVSETLRSPQSPACEILESSQESSDVLCTKTEVLPLEISTVCRQVKFVGEQDKAGEEGLESIANRHFFELFDLKKPNSILINENQKFITSPTLNDRTQKCIANTRSIPDSILMILEESRLKIVLVEYECYGGTSRSAQSRKFNSHIIPQLMRFASAFAVTTEQSVREKTITNWSDKIIDVLLQSPELMDKAKDWARQLCGDAYHENDVLRQLGQYIGRALRETLEIWLVIDEISSEQIDLLRKMLSAFLLPETEQPIAFSAKLLTLHQRSAELDSKADHMLSCLKF
jgi:hypothetical protein